MRIQSLGLEGPLEKEMATHYSILFQKIQQARGFWWVTVHGGGGRELSHKLDKIEHFSLQNLLYSIKDSTQYSVITQMRKESRSAVKNLPTNIEDVKDACLIPGLKDLLEEGKATHSSILAWRVPRTEEPGGLRFTGWQRVGHD